MLWCRPPKFLLLPHEMGCRLTFACTAWSKPDMQTINHTMAINACYRDARGGPSQSSAGRGPRIRQSS
ncbi:hypothetical protein BURKHO8Y_580014 [Burkholderia sp. 8Y]|nr:hypothetical protein BURKHO8Y_580014 [Burkholderia sp. 8Y]